MTGMRPVAVTMAVLALAGCKDSGLPGKNLPLQLAEHKPLPYPVYSYPQGQLQVGAIEVAGRDWLTVQVEERIPDALMVALPTGDGPTVYALAWDDAPYDRLYHQLAAGRYRRRVQIPRVDLAAAAAARASHDAPGAAAPADGGHDDAH